MPPLRAFCDSSSLPVQHAESEWNLVPHYAESEWNLVPHCAEACNKLICCVFNFS